MFDEALRRYIQKKNNIMFIHTMVANRSYINIILLL